MAAASASVNKDAPHLRKLGLKRLDGKVAIITGGSRGIGREVALTLAGLGCNIVVAAKSDTEQADLPGTIFSVAAECQALGVQALPVKCNLLVEADIDNCVKQVMAKFGRIDILVNNASALWWQPIVGTPSKRYDLINGINARGTFLITRAVLPHMEQGGRGGHIVNMSPPIDLDPNYLSGRVAYNISKFGMTLVALGAAAEYREKNIAANSLWPKTIVESQAAKNFSLGPKSWWRKASVLADATAGIVCEDPATFTGKMLIDEDYLRSKGFDDTDLAVYRVDAEVEPPNMGDLVRLDQGKMMRRGHARDVSKHEADVTHTVQSRL